jgi:mono/diheme cytochrome c family protein
MRGSILAGFVGAALMAAVLVIIALAWLWLGGFDPRASSQSHLAPLALDIAVKQRMEAGAARVGPPPAPDVRRLVLGYRQYDAECAACHGTPDASPAPWAKSMSPQPPDLSETSTHLSPKALFWLICHGVKMTGMPAFGVQRTDDKIWDLALFVRTLPTMKAQDYERLRATYGPAPKAFSLTPDAVCLHGA